MCGDKIPWFVSHYLDKLPPLTFNNLDVSSLLGKMERLHSEISTLRQAGKLQADVGEDLCSMTATIGHRVNAVECRLETSSGGSAISAGENSEELAKKVADGCAPGSPANPNGVRAPASPRRPTNLTRSRASTTEPHSVFMSARAPIGAASKLSK